MAVIRITSGSKGRSFSPTWSTGLMKETDYLAKSADTIATIFKDDPVIRYLTSSLSKEAHYTYIAAYIHTLLKAGMLNEAIFQEANDWSCCAVWLPPKARLDGPLTIIRAGFVQCIFKLGLGGVKVCTSSVSRG